MEIPLSSIQSAVQKIKSEIFSIDIDLYSFVCPSAYDTAWLAIIPDSRYPSEPMFKNYLNWLLNNQKPEGFWGESDTFGKPTFESLPATLVSMVALKKWNRGKSMIEKGRSFIRAYADKLLNEVRDDFPRWFVIVLPAMVELADTIGLDVDFPEASRKTMSYICSCRESFLNKEEHEGGLRCYPPLLSHLEALPASYVSEEDICRHLSIDGSLFQSPSATAKAFMAFRNKECFTYLHSSVKWYETFASWLMEAKWSRTGHTPSLDNYLITSMISIAAHTVVLPASCFLNVPNEKLRPTQYEAITKLLMVICRLLNDVQSYQKEKEEGKINCVLVNMVENPESNIEDSIALVGEIIDKKKKELLEHALIEGHSNLSKASNLLHLSCLKVFHMFFNSSNRYDSDTEMLQDISKAIYLPVSKNSKPLEVVPLQSMPKKINPTTPISYSNSCFKHYKRTSFTAHRVSQPDLRKGRAMVPLTHKVALGLL